MFPAGKTPKLPLNPLEAAAALTARATEGLSMAATESLSMAQAAAVTTQAADTLSHSPGIDDWSARADEAHPRPVVLVHGTFGNAETYWIVTAPVLAAAGYSVFRLDYGADPRIPLFHGITSMEESAEELAAFVDRVLAATGAEKVDIVGHSQGGMLPRYYLKFLGGASKVHHLIGLAPNNHGTTGNGIAALMKQYPITLELTNLVTPALTEQHQGSVFMNKLNEGGDTVEGVRYTVIATKYDQVVTPYTGCFLKGPNVRNVLVQDLCPADISMHNTLVYSPYAMRELLNALAGRAPEDTKETSKAAL
ncbi:esterase/lipase family protein [Streptomyces poonensis]|uniref:Lipase n=1 Tax=Streptomyces poonensis TaxID=68255 RepID=A0A918UR21_9ACTN|nr:alpha/beta fold hydrolase [Streptomyces poonensis]GGZ28397.1 lipase [Streptomyces poonensis]GLJ89829.1 lipase [Streptomyces poonensis]